MSKYSLVRLMAVAVSVILFAACNAGSGSNDLDPNLGDEWSCANADGLWLEMSSGCGDACYTGGDMVCAAVMVDGCDCGDDMCWDGYDCVVGMGYDDTHADPAPPDEQLCVGSGGTWEEFSNGCADKCGVNEDSYCTQELVMACNCGEDRCWETVFGGCIGFVVLPVGASPDPLSAAALAEYQACTDDSDCIFVTNGCCDCANGGEEVAINEDLLDEFAEEFNCDTIDCTERARIPSCGSGVTSCVDGMCEYTL